MGDKFDGALAGGGAYETDEMGISEALQDLALHETLVAQDESGAQTLLRAVQNPYYGGVMMVAEPGGMSSFRMMEAIKLSQMTSMLNDKDRCSKYEAAISALLKKWPGSRVLDIGSGTGLLAMLAARAGASHVDAVEMFQPLADLSCRIIRDNQLHDRIAIHASKSTELVAGVGEQYTPGAHIQQKADILVTEIFDSALLGEACLPVIAHAWEHLLKKSALVIPAKATLSGVLLSSDFLTKFHDLGADFPFHRGQSARNCQSSGKGIPMHFENLKEGKDYEIISEQFDIFEFDFSEKSSLSLEQTKALTVSRIKQGLPCAVLTWWELDLAGDGTVCYSSKPGIENWQDHWLPVVYPLPARACGADQQEHIYLTASHDQLSVWFALGTDVRSRPTCACGFHALPGGAYRIFEIGCPGRLGSLKARIYKAIKKAVSLRRPEDMYKPVRCLDLSDSSVCGLLAAQMDTRYNSEVISVEEDSQFSAFLYEQVSRQCVKSEKNYLKIVHAPLSSFLMQEYSERNVETGGWTGVEVAMSEPYTRPMCGYPLATLANLVIQRNAITQITAEHFVMVPSSAVIKAQVISFADNTLQRAFGAVQEVQGFDHGRFADLYDEWPGCERISIPLFQYRTAGLSQEETLLTVDLCQLDAERLTTENKTVISVEGRSKADAVAVWVEYDGEAASRVGRSEVMWVDEATQTSVSEGGSIELLTVFDCECGTFDIKMSAAQR